MRFLYDNRDCNLETKRLLCVTTQPPAVRELNLPTDRANGPKHKTTICCVIKGRTEQNAALSFKLRPPLHGARLTHAKGNQCACARPCTKPQGHNVTTFRDTAQCCLGEAESTFQRCVLPTPSGTAVRFFVCHRSQSSPNRACATNTLNPLASLTSHFKRPFVETKR